MVGENNANSEEVGGQDIPAERDKRALIRQIKHDLQNGGDHEAVKNPLATSQRQDVLLPGVGVYP